MKSFIHLRSLKNKTPIRRTMAFIFVVKIYFQILFRLKQLCYKNGSNDIMNQQLLKNMRVHEYVLGFLSIPYDKVNILPYIFHLQSMVNLILQFLFYYDLYNFIIYNIFIMMAVIKESNVIKRVDQEMPKLFTLCHEFLQSFCRNNKLNQYCLQRYISVDSDHKEGCLRIDTVRQFRIYASNSNIYIFTKI